MKNSPERDEAIFETALQFSPAERVGYLDQACAGDAQLRQRVEAMLQAHEEAGHFMTEPVAPPPAATIQISPESMPVSEKPGDRIGHYKLLEQIGEGGCGVVYMAEQEEPIRRRVAFKVIKLGMDTKQVIARFEAERQALALMDHPNIAKVLDAGATETGRPYFVMELVRGIKITDYCDQNNLSTETRLELFMEVCHAIQHAHQKGIIHRDIKPSNILVTLHDGKPVPKVIDFGIAKATGGQLLTDKTLFTAFEQFIGTPAYMSPEQAEMSGLDIDTRSDIYALGVLLYELLTGKTPFDAKELVEAGLAGMRRIIREKEPARPSTKISTLGAEEQTTIAKRRQVEAPKLIHQVRGDLDWIVMKCLEKDRTRRYEGASGLALDIEHHLKNEPVTAAAPGAVYRARKFVRRHKVALGMAVTVLVLLVAGALVSTWQAVRATRARIVAQAAEKEAERARDAEKQERLRADTEKTSAQRHLYAANMNLAQQAWEQANLARARQLLTETATYPDRGFEWYYWQRQTHRELRILRGHNLMVWAVAFSPEGQRIVTGDEIMARVWDATSGKRLLTLGMQTNMTRSVLFSITSVVFSPDGQRILIGYEQGTATVWDATSGKELVTLRGHEGEITSVAFSSDGKRIVTGSRDRTARVWDATSGRELLTLSGHTNAISDITSVAFSRDGQRIATGSDDKSAKVWDAANGKELLTLNGHTNFVLAVAFSPDGQRIVTGSFDKTARVWDAINGKEIFTFTGHNSSINCVAISPGGDRIVTGSGDRTAKVWEAANGKEVLSLIGHEDYIECVAFSPDGQRIVTGSRDRTARVWEVASGKDQPTITGAHSAFLSPDGQRIVTLSNGGAVKVYETISGKELMTFTGHSNLSLTLVASRAGQRVVIGGEEQMATVYEAASGTKLSTLKGHNFTLPLSLSDEGERILTTSERRALIVWEVGSGKKVSAIEYGARGEDDLLYGCAVLSPDGRKVITTHRNGTAKVWEAANGQQLLTLKRANDGIMYGLFSTDGQRIITQSHLGATVWEAANGKELLSFGRGGVQCIAFSPDGQRIVAGADQTARVCETSSGKELLSLKGHGGMIRAAAFSPDGKRIVTGSDDQTAKVWEFVSGKELLTLKGHTGAINSVAFSPDGQRIVTGSDDNTVRVWESTSAAQVARWQDEEQGSPDVIKRERAAAAARDMR